jgi:hypothetical protein
MTTVRWEYAFITWTQEAHQITRADPEYRQLSAEVHTQWEREGWAFFWWYEQRFSIHVSGAAKADIRQAWTAAEDHRANVNLLEILNELGTDGWELVSYGVLSSAIGGDHGPRTAGSPIQTQAWLKRPAND